jgi:hypothetical protein
MKMVDKGGAASWDSKRYLNIWICKLSSRSLGYATPPGAAADKDGVVIAYDAFGTVGNLRPVFNKGQNCNTRGWSLAWFNSYLGRQQLRRRPGR